MPSETFGSTSPGTLLQLVAQGPEDAYLTGGERPYYYPYDLDYYGPYQYTYFPDRRNRFIYY
jgi:hypothetical protein